MGWRSVAEVQEFYEKNGLPATIAAGTGKEQGTYGKLFYRSWVAAHHAKDADEDRQLRIRAVLAAEEAADSAARSASWTMLAAVAAFLTAVVSALVQWYLLKGGE